MTISEGDIEHKRLKTVKISFCKGYFIQDTDKLRDEVRDPKSVNSTEDIFFRRFQVSPTLGVLNIIGIVFFRFQST